MTDKYKEKYAAPEAEIKEAVESLPYGVNGVDFIAGPVVAGGHEDFMKYLKTRGRPKSNNPKKRIDMFLDADVADKLRGSGRGWQTRLSAKITEWAGAGAI